jgi:sugar phosphate isomerase/epimerase
VSRTVLASTGIVTQEPEPTDHRVILEHAPKLGAAGYELQMHDAWYGHLDEVVQDLRASDLALPAVHADKQIGAGLGSRESGKAEKALATLEVNSRAAAAVGAQILVLHLWEEPTNDEEIARNLEHLPACVDTASAYNLVLAIETVQGTAGTALANVRLAIERDPRCRVTLDTEFLGFHGQLEESIDADWLWDENHVRHVHVKDFDGRLRDGDTRYYRLPGEGKLNLVDFLTGLVERGYDGAITLEASAITDGKLDERRLQQIAGAVRQLSGT